MIFIDVKYSAAERLQSYQIGFLPVSFKLSRRSLAKYGEFYGNRNNCEKRTTAVANKRPMPHHDGAKFI